MTVLQFTRVERAEDVLNCQGISFEAWLARVEAASGIDFSPDAGDWAHGNMALPPTITRCGCWAGSAV